MMQDIELMDHKEQLQLHMVLFLIQLNLNQDLHTIVMLMEIIQIIQIQKDSIILEL